MTPSDDKRYGPTAGLVTGWIGVVACSALAIGLPFTGHDRTTLRFAVGGALAALVIWAFTARPRIILTRDTLVLRNPLSSWQVPVGLVDTVTVRVTTLVAVADRSFEGVAVGRPLRNLKGAKPRSWVTPDPVPDLMVSEVLEAAERSRAAGGPTGEVERVWAVPVLVSFGVLVLVLLGLFV